MLSWFFCNAERDAKIERMLSESRLRDAQAEQIRDKISKCKNRNKRRELKRLAQKLKQESRNIGEAAVFGGWTP